MIINKLTFVIEANFVFFEAQNAFVNFIWKLQKSKSERYEFL